MSFHFESGVAVDGFFQFVDLYLSSTAIYVCGSLYVQADGICIGSSMATVLYEVYLIIFFKW